MSEISRALGNDTDAAKYDVISHPFPCVAQFAHERLFQNQSSGLLREWTSLAMSSDQSHILGFYGEENSTSLLYNIYADRLLGTGLFSQSVGDHYFPQASMHRLILS